MRSCRNCRRGRVVVVAVAAVVQERGACGAREGWYMPPRRVVWGATTYRDQSAFCRSHVCDSKRAIAGASVEPTEPERGETALHQRESSLAFLMSPITRTEAAAIAEGHHAGREHSGISTSMRSRVIS
jgi:hypothetical protein